MHLDSKIHRFDGQIEGVGLPARFTYPFNYVPHPLVEMASAQLRGYLATRTHWHREISLGKMFGVLIVRDGSGALGFLAAFSGLLDKRNAHDYFVPAVYDMQHPDGYFREQEAVISAINRRIDSLENSQEYMDLVLDLQTTESYWQTKVSLAQSEYRAAKRSRRALRQGITDLSELERLNSLSQFQKGELSRLKQTASEMIEAVRGRIQDMQSQITALRSERAERSNDLQQWLFQQFKVLNASQEEISLRDIFLDTPSLIPPAGAGECAAPKLLQYAYLHNLEPIAMGEFWQGESPRGEIRRDGEFYPSCNSKCRPILGFMLQGLDVDPDPLAHTADDITSLDVVYRDEYLMVVNKPSGLLSASGKVSEHSVESLIPRFFPEITTPLLVHRLDMATSGLLLVALKKSVHQNLQSQFEQRTIKKSYVALLEGLVLDDSGVISLPLIADFEDRPRQRVDYQSGKEAVTRYRVLEHTGSRTLIEFSPETGRTHQLRLHSAHVDGLNAPIVGDTLYGRADKRLCLHAQKIEFTHPVTRKIITLEISSEF